MDKKKKYFEVETDNEEQTSPKRSQVSCLRRGFDEQNSGLQAASLATLHIWQPGSYCNSQCIVLTVMLCHNGAGRAQVASLIVQYKLLHHLLCNIRSKPVLCSSTGRERERERNKKTKKIEEIAFEP
jgi:hypothetical protein